MTAQAKDVPGEAPANLADAVKKALTAMWQNPVVKPEPYVVHPLEGAWINNQVGPPPSTQAVLVAWRVGAIDRTHPAAEALMARYRGTLGADPESDRG